LTYLGAHAEGLWMPVAMLAVLCAALRNRLALCALFYPVEVSSDPDLLLAMSIAWIGVARCFGLTRSRSASFSLVPSLAPFGLVGALNLSPGIVLGFFVFLFAGVFVLGYERLLAEEERVRGGRGGGIATRRRVHSQLVASSVLLVAVAALGAAAGTGLHRVMPTLATALAKQIGATRADPATLESLSTDIDTELQVGQGPIELQHIELMYIRCGEARLWRTAVYDEYMGNGWRRSLRRGRGAGARGQPVDLRQRRLVAVRGPQRIVEQTVEPLTELPEELPAAAQPVRVQFEWPGYETRVFVVDAYGCVRLRWSPPTGSEFTVWSAVSNATGDDLRGAPNVDRTRFPGTYLRLPLETAVEARGIAEHIAGDAPTAYDKAVAIADYLRENQAYTLDGPYIPEHRDAAIDFLTRHRRGACDLFATAFVVLARAQGVPARVAVGYNTGEYDPEEQAYLVHEDQAHAWAEVYFPGYGWITFDPSAGATLARPSLWSLLKIGQYWGFIVAVLKRVLVAAATIGFLLWLVSAAFNVPVVTEVLRYRQRRRARDPRTRLMAVYERVCGLLAKAGLGRRAWQTPAEYSAAIAALCDRQSPSLCAAFEALTHALERARYDRGPVSDGDAAAAQESATHVADGLREMRRAVGRRPLQAAAAGGDGS
ncbi:MAG: transglutaminase domain-containing protein, partial [Armatimonadota bacterium]